MRSAIWIRESACGKLFFLTEKIKIYWDTLPGKSHFALRTARLFHISGNYPIGTASCFLFKPTNHFVELCKVVSHLKGFNPHRHPSSACLDMIAHLLELPFIPDDLPSAFLCLIHQSGQFIRILIQNKTHHSVDKLPIGVPFCPIRIEILDGLASAEYCNPVPRIVFVLYQNDFK